MTKPTTAAKKTPPAKAATVKAGTKVGQPKRAARGGQQSKATPIDPYKEKQGQQIGIGGTAKVAIVIDVVPATAYSPRTVKDERYPFSELDNSREIEGQLIGPRFFIPDSDTPNRHLATARKRHRPDQDRFTVIKFNTRKGTDKGVPGVFVWRAPADEEQAWITEVNGKVLEAA